MGGRGTPPTPVSPCPISPPLLRLLQQRDTPLFEGGVGPIRPYLRHLCRPSRSQTTPQPTPEPAPPLSAPRMRHVLASIPSPKSLVAHLDQYVIGQDIAKRRLALGVTNHYKRLVDAWDR